MEKQLQSKPLSGPTRDVGLVEKIGELRDGARILYEWLGHGAVPVSHSTASIRAEKCSVCPMNIRGAWLDTMTKHVAEAISEQVSQKAHMELKTPHDSKIHFCDSCGCYLPLKVWVPLNTITEHMDIEDIAALHPDCWILHEIVS